MPKQARHDGEHDGLARSEAYPIMEKPVEGVPAIRAGTPSPRPKRRPPQAARCWGWPISGATPSCWSIPIWSEYTQASAILPLWHR